VGLGNAPAPGTIALIVLTALIGALVAVFGKRAAEALLELLLKPFKWIWKVVYRWIAPRNPFSLALRIYKKHIRRSWLTKIENPIGPEMDVPLEHAFAPLKLISSSTDENIDLFTHVAASYRSIVLGGPGTGKTTLMKSLITRVINAHANDDLNQLIPVFVVLRKLAAKQQSVREAIVAAFADFHFPGADRYVDSALSQGRMLIILDGLDEVGVNREYVAGQIISFCERDDQQETKNRVIVTCREYSYRTEDLRSVIKNVVRVEPFANHHMRVFLQGWPMYKGRSALKLYGFIQGDPQIRDICRNPLLLTILTGLYLETNDFEFPTSRALFYQAAVEELIVKRQARRETKQKFDAKHKWDVLERVSLNRLETVRINEDPEEFTSEAIREQSNEVFQKEIDFDEFIQELVEVNGIIKPSSDGIYTCAHRTIQEYFAASEAGRIRTPKEVYYRFSNRQDLIEVLYFYCGMLNNIPQLTEIIQAFVSEGKWLEAGRCLLNMKETPTGSYIETITTELGKQIVDGSEFKPALEILSSLA
jgi:NACHT domain